VIIGLFVYIEILLYGYIVIWLYWSAFS